MGLIKASYLLPYILKHFPLSKILETHEVGIPKCFLLHLLLPFAQIFSKKLSGVFIIVTVNAQVFPVRPVRRIIQVISIFVVDRQKISCFFIKLSSAFGTDEAMYLEGTLSVITSFWTRFL